MRKARERQAGAAVERVLDLPEREDRRSLLARAMAVEVSCVLRGWLEEDEDLRDLSPPSLVEILYLRLCRVASDPQLSSALLPVNRQETSTES